MAKSNHDDLADALARMANGESAHNEAESSAEQEHAPQAPPRSRTPAQPVPSQRKAAAVPTPRPAAPRPPVQAAPIPTPAPVKAPRPAAPARPRAPIAADPAPAPSQEEPAATFESDEAESDNHEPDGEPAIFDDGDSVIAPAPDADVFMHHTPSAASIKRHRAAVYQTVEFRRTIIPILLTSGVLMLIFAMAKFVVGADSPLADLPGWLPVALIITGLVLVGLGVMNMLSVQNSLAAVDSPRK